MAISKQAINLNENILSSARSVVASLDPASNDVNLVVQLLINSEEEKPDYSEEEKLTKRLIDTDDDINSTEVNIYKADIKVISKKVDPQQTLIVISFNAHAKVPKTPGF